MCDYFWSEQPGTLQQCSIPKFYQKLLERLNIFMYVAGYRINLHKSIDSLDTINKSVDNETMDILSVTVAIKQIKYSRINLARKFKDLYKEKFKHMKKDIEKIENRKASYAQGLVELIL